jgi:hypothetical protein
VVDPAEGDQEGEVRLSIVKPKKQKTPVGVGAEGGGAEEIVDGDGSPDSGAPEISEPDEQ